MLYFDRIVVCEGIDLIKQVHQKSVIYSCYRMVASAIWEIFSEFLMFYNLFHEPLGE